MAKLKQIESRMGRWILSLLGIAGLATACLMYGFDRAAYFRLLTFLIIKPYTVPFIDAQAVPAAIDCARHGINVFNIVPCDPLHRRWDYSPVWLWASFLPTWSNWMGICLDGAFLLSLVLLPQPRGLLGATIGILAIFSSVTVFALERGNVDILMFMLIIIGGSLFFGNIIFRLIAYAFFGFAGLLKFYPCVLFILFARERIAAFILLCCATFMLLAAFAWRYFAALQAAARNVPVFSSFTDAFGSRQFSSGLEIAIPYLFYAFGIKDGFFITIANCQLFAPGIRLILIIAACGLAFRLAVKGEFAAAFAKLQPDEHGFLVIGAALICCNFFTCENVTYRCIFFLFAMPGVLALARAPRVGRLFGITAAAILSVMWGLTIQLLVATLFGGHAFPMGGSVAIYLYWIFRELTWWWIISVFMAILICFIAQSPAWRFLRRHARISR